MDLTRPSGLSSSPRRHGVLVTLRRDGRPQLSNILLPAWAPTASSGSRSPTSRAKTKNLRARSRGPPCTSSGDDFWHTWCIDAQAELSPVGRRPR